MASLHVTTIHDDPALVRLFAIFGAADCCWFASTRPNGHAHLAPIWHAVYGDQVYIVTQSGAVRANNIQRQPYVSLALPDPMNVLVVEGIARAAPELRDELRPLFQAKYNWDIATDTDYDLVVAIAPRKVMAWGSHGEGKWTIDR